MSTFNRLTKNTKCAKFLIELCKQTEGYTGMSANTVFQDNEVCQKYQKEQVRNFMRKCKDTWAKKQKKESDDASVEKNKAAEQDQTMEDVGCDEEEDNRKRSADKTPVLSNKRSKVAPKSNGASSSRVAERPKTPKSKSVDHKPIFITSSYTKGGTRKYKAFVFALTSGSGDTNDVLVSINDSNELVLKTLVPEMLLNPEKILKCLSQAIGERAKNGGYGNALEGFLQWARDHKEYSYDSVWSEMREKLPFEADKQPTLVQMMKVKNHTKKNCTAIVYVEVASLVSTHDVIEMGKVVEFCEDDSMSDFEM